MSNDSVESESALSKSPMCVLFVRMTVNVNTSQPWGSGGSDHEEDG